MEGFAVKMEQTICLNHEVSMMMNDDDYICQGLLDVSRLGAESPG